MRTLGSYYDQTHMNVPLNPKETKRVITVYTKILSLSFKWKNNHEYLVTSCAFSNSDSKYVVSISEVDLLTNIWDVGTGQLVMSIPGRECQIYIIRVC